MNEAENDTPGLVRLSDSLGLAAEAPTLVERLRTDVLWHQRRGNDTIARDCQEAADEIERLREALRTYFAAADAAWVELCAEAQKQGISSMPILPGQARALDQYNELRRVFGA